MRGGDVPGALQSGGAGRLCGWAIPRIADGWDGALGGWFVGKLVFAESCSVIDFFREALADIAGDIGAVGE